MSLNSPRGVPPPKRKPSPSEIAQARDSHWLDIVLPDGAKQEAKGPPKPSPRELAQARDWLDDVLPDGAKQEAKDLFNSTKTVSTLALSEAGFALQQVAAPAAAEPKEEHAHPSPRVAEVVKKPSFFQRTASRLRRGMPLSKKKDTKGAAAKDGWRREESDEFYMGASGTIVLGHTRSTFMNRSFKKQKQPKPLVRTASGKSMRDSLSDWLADVLPDGLRSSRKSRSSAERSSKPMQPQVTASTAGWKSAGFATPRAGPGRGFRGFGLAQRG